MFKVSDYEQSTGAYLKDIGGFKPLTKHDEMKLWRRIKKNPEDVEAKDKLINSNLKFVVSVANSYKGRGLSMSDLVAEGNIGLMKAYYKFDPKKDVKFISYSVHWIRQSIMEALQKRNSIDSEDLPLDYEKQEDGVDEDYIEADNTPNLITRFVDNDRDSEAERVKKQKQALEMLFSSLNEREREIITRYFGISHDGETLEEIGKTLNLTKERVRQIKEDGLKKLRSYAIGSKDVMNIYKEYVISEN